MKNIHLLPTDQPSNLHFDSELFFTTNIQLSKEINSIVEGRNIYITSNEKIKEGDWHINLLTNEIEKASKNLSVNFNTQNDFGSSVRKQYKKIILTTDQDLIADGVQAIDDEFLEWFVKNPSCEEVKTRKIGKEWIYNADVPKEESKQEGYICPHTKIQCDDECCVSAEDCHITSSLATGMVDCDEPKQETLEEAANRLFYTVGNEGISSIDSFMKGADWQAERMYSEEEVIDILYSFHKEENSRVVFSLSGITKWFEQFKKK